MQAASERNNISMLNQNLSGQYRAIPEKYFPLKMGALRPPILVDCQKSAKSCNHRGCNRGEGDTKGTGAVSSRTCNSGQCQEVVVIAEADFTSATNEGVSGSSTVGRVNCDCQRHRRDGEELIDSAEVEGVTTT